MSKKVLARVFFKDEFINLKKEIEASFYITELGVKHKIGINCGGNISKSFAKILRESKKNEFIFELTDDPMDINTEVLFSGNNVICSVGENRIDFGESLYSRMNRVQLFFEELIKNKKIKVVTIDIDALDTFDYQEFETISIGVNKFCSTMIELYERGDQIMPTIRIKFI